MQNLLIYFHNIALRYLPCSIDANSVNIFIIKEAFLDLSRKGNQSVE